MPDQPNILFILTDTQRFDTLACYGNSLIQTPNLNAVADQSFVFENTYVASPICAPARSTLLTGLWPHTNGVKVNNIPLPPDVKTMADMVPESYYSANYGKWHLGDEVIKRKGFDRWVPTEDVYRAYYSDPKYLSIFSDYHHFLVDNGFVPDQVFDRLGVYSDEHEKIRPAEGKGMDIFSLRFVSKLPEEFTKASFLGRRTAEFIHENSARPFFLFVSTFEPHPPFTGPFYDLYDPESMPVGPAFLKHPPANASKLHRIPAKYAAPPPQLRGLDERDIPGASDELRWRTEIAHYWDNITHLDKAVGEMLRALDDAGIADNTIVVFTSEHGDQMGAHHLPGKGVMYEESVRVPLLMRVPWLTDRQTMIPGRFSQIDVVPTLLDLIGEPVPDHLQGQSRVDVLKNDATLDGNDVMIDWNGIKTQPPQHNPEVTEASQTPHRTLITADGWKLTLGDPEHGELYDLNTDPHEMNNLYDDPAQSDRIHDLVGSIRTWQEETGDTLALPMP